MPPNTIAEEAEADQFYEDLRPSRTNKKKKCPFYHRGLERESKKSRDTLEKQASFALEYKMKQGTNSQSLVQRMH